MGARSEGDGAGRRILVVDDDPGVREVLEAGLREAGFEVAAAGSFAAARERVGRGRFDLALVDQMLPEPAGVEILDLLRRRDPSCVRILLSGHVDLPLALDAVNRGEVARVIPKPFDLDRLLAEMRAALASKEERGGPGAGRRRAREERLLRAAFEERRFHLVFQPIVRAADGVPVACEALLRCTHARLSHPEAVLRAAERAGLLPAVADEVVRLAARALPSLPPHILLFLNLHPRDFEAADDLLRRLATLRPWADRIAIEITERADVGAIPGIEEKVERIAGLGFRLALDDVGAGYNSLNVLAGLCPHYLKIDRGLVEGVDGHPRKRGLVRLLVEFAGEIEALVIAEGVETAGEERVLREARVDLLQGFRFGRPGPLPLARGPGLGVSPGPPAGGPGPGAAPGQPFRKPV